MLSTSMSYKRLEFKEKFVELSEDIFKGSSTTTQPLFWDNYLILPVNTLCITKLIQSKSEESLLDLQHTLRVLFQACLNHMECTPESMSERTRQVNSITILTVLLRNLFSKKRLSHFNIISILTGLDQADVLFSRLVKAIQQHLIKETRAMVLQLAFVVSAGRDNVNQNGLNGYFMTNDLSPTLFQALAREEEDENLVRDIVMLLGMLSNYNKYESRNPYLEYIKKCRQGKSLETIIHMYTSTLTSLRSRYIQLNDDEETLSKSMVNYMSKWFSSSTPLAPTEAENFESLSSLPSAQTALLLPLFDLINTNTYFINTLINICTKIDAEHKEEGNKVTLITSLISFASYLFQNNRTERSKIYSRLLLTILLRLMEENSVLNYMAKEEGSSASIRLCRQRSPPLPWIKGRRSLFCCILDDMIFFVKHNIRKKLDLVSYKMAFNVIHRILSFMSKHKIRPDYRWTELWPTLTAVLHFTALKLEELHTRDDFVLYLSALISIFNMCVTHGETFLSDTKSYDSLYYEIIRATSDFMKLSEYVNRSVLPTSRDSRTPTITLNEFYNIQLICNHFKPALDDWQQAKNIKFPTPQQVMNIINDNYATLELRSMDKLDAFIAFAEIPTEMGFFRQVLRVVTIDYLEYYTLSISSS